MATRSKKATAASSVPAALVRQVLVAVQRLEAGQVRTDAAVSELRTGQERLEGTVSELRTGQQRLEAGQVRTDTAVSELRAGQERLDEVVTQTGILVEEMRNQNSATIDAVEGFERRLTRKMDEDSRNTNARMRGLELLLKDNCGAILKLEEKLDRKADASAVAAFEERVAVLERHG